MRPLIEVQEFSSANDFLVLISLCFEVLKKRVAKLRCLFRFACV